MIEKVVLDYLKKRINVPVVMENVPDDEYVLIEKTGSGRENHVFSATLVVQSYANSLYNAALLNEEVKEILLGSDDSYGIIEIDEICKCELNSDYNYTDTTTKKYRYQAVFDITHY